jgi:UDP-glucose:(heptosyl)LPS alpha-1,3-glucosyltransferase
MEEALFRRRRYRRLIALTPRVRTDLQRFYGVDPSLVEVLPNGFSRGAFNVGLRRTYRRLLRGKLGLPEDAWVVLFVANEWERKGFLPLLEAVARLKDRTVHVVAVGNLPKAFLMKEAEKLGVSGRVHMVGASEGVQGWFGMADVFVLPTVYEAWGMVIVEAMAAGLPVLTSRRAGAAVAVKDAFSGLLLEDPTDVLEIALGLEKLRAGVLWTGAEIAASVSEYEWPAILERYESILRASV